MNSAEEDNKTEAELWKERVDDLQVVVDDLREKNNIAYERLHRAEEETQLLREQNRELTARVGRLTLHLQQGVEL